MMWVVVLVVVAFWVVFFIGLPRGWWDVQGDNDWLEWPW